MLANFNKSTDFNEVCRQSQEPEKSKKQVLSRSIGTNKPETQWFCVHNDDLIFKKNIEHKTKCRCFFDVNGIVQKGSLLD
ncbi:hypothetical protein CA265_14925 [Sphingobacteriaceae bacterium GW460-11-11-14-LB5]|nr:hypothetical protein CA265_14925 [Sphingobacteriaceae bacterium GW460-11-11-14-LB5]